MNANKARNSSEKKGWLRVKTQKKRNVIFLCTVCLLILVTFVSTGCSVLGLKNEIPIPEVQKGIYVYDEDDIIDDETEQKLNTLLIELESKTTAEVAVITVPSLLDMEIEDYSYKLANTLGIGKADEDNGVLLLISRNDTKVRLEIGKGLEGCFNDSKCGRILDNYFVPYREKDEYSEGTYQTIQVVTSVIAEEYDTTLDELNEEIAQEFKEKEKEKEEEQSQVVFWIIVIVVIIIIILTICDFTIFDGAIIGALGSAASSSGGGFGGGSFGGGGASR